LIILNASIIKGGFTATLSIKALRTLKLKEIFLISVHFYGARS
jgi:hypothetical protein